MLLSLCKHNEIKIAKTMELKRALLMLGQKINALWFHRSLRKELIPKVVLMIKTQCRHHQYKISASTMKTKASSPKIFSEFDQVL